MLLNNIPFPMAKKVNTSNKVAITCLCIKLYNSRSQYKCCKNKIKYLQYYYLIRQDYANTDIVKEDTDTAIVLKRKKKENNH